MEFSKGISRLVATTFILSLSLPTTGLVPAFAESTATVPSDCESSVQHLTARESVQEAAAEAGSEISFTCLSDLVTVQVTDSAGEDSALVAETTTEREIVDMTGMTDEQIAETGPVVEVGSVDLPAPETLPLLGKTYGTTATTINHASRASSNDTVYWGQRTSANVVIWMSSARIATYISLQKSLHPFNLNYQSLGGRQIVMTVPVQMRQHNRGAVDSVVDTNYFTAAAYGTGYAATKNLLTTGRAGKFFPRMTGIYLDDRTAGRRFQVAGTIVYPRFQCYDTVVCKYPNGKEAPW